MMRFIAALLLGILAGTVVVQAAEPSPNAKTVWHAWRSQAAWRKAEAQAALQSGDDGTWGGAASPLGEGGAIARLKDIANIQGVRENQLVGYGLVIGLEWHRRQPAQCTLHRTILARDARQSRY